MIFFFQVLKDKEIRKYLKSLKEGSDLAVLFQRFFR